jgi:hypothetical protein
MMDFRWLAGFFDGEGCVYLQSMTRVNRRLPRYCLQISITQNDRFILEEIQKEFGGQVYLHKGRRCYRWRITGMASLPFLQAVCPYVRIKKDQVDLAIEFVASMRKANLGPVSMGDEVNERRFFIHNRLKELKHG